MVILRIMNTQRGQQKQTWVPALKLASKFNVSRSSIYRMADAGIIPSIRLGSKLGARRFDEDAVCEALEKHLSSLGRDTAESETSGGA